MYSYRLAVQQSSKLFEVSSVRLDAFSDKYDHRTCNLTKHSSVGDDSCSAENAVVLLSSSTCVHMP